MSRLRVGDAISSKALWPLLLFTVHAVWSQVPSLADLDRFCNRRKISSYIEDVSTDNRAVRSYSCQKAPSVRSFGPGAATRQLGR